METMEGQNRIKFLKLVNEGEEDRISALPDCLLIEILSRLPSTKDAIRTGKLSKRWKHIWTMVSSLIFQHYDDNRPWPDYIDKTLTQCRQLKLQKFEIHSSYHFTNYDTRFESQVSNWIRYAVSCKVEELNLTFTCMEEAKILLNQFFFVSSCFIDLTLEGCIFNPTGPISWKNLRSLCIYYGKLEEDLIENILSGSPQLETLVLDRCYGYSRLDITSKSVKNLVFSGYINFEDQYLLDDIIEINAPNILSLTIKGALLLWELSLVDVSSLVEAYLNYEKLGHYESTRKEDREEMLNGLIVNLRHVKKLKVGGFCLKALSRLEAKGFDFPSTLMKFPDENSDWSDSDSDW